MQAELTVRFRDPSEPVFREGRCRDLSRLGLVVETQVPAEVGSLVRFELAASSGVPVDGLARVAWVEGGLGGAMGLRFLRLDDQGQKRVAEWLRPAGAELEPPQDSVFTALSGAIADSLRPPPPPDEPPRDPRVSSTPPLRERVSSTPPLRERVSSLPPRERVSSAPPRERVSLAPARELGALLTPRDHSTPPAPLAALLAREPEPPSEPASGLRERQTPSEPIVASSRPALPDAVLAGRTFVVQDGVLTARVDLHALGRGLNALLFLLGLGVVGYAGYAWLAPAPRSSPTPSVTASEGARGARAPSRPVEPTEIAPGRPPSSAPAPAEAEVPTGIAVPKAVPAPDELRPALRAKSDKPSNAPPPPSLASDAPAVAPSPAPAESPPVETRLSQARACLVRGDNACVVALLEHDAQTDAEWALLVETLRVLRQADKAEATMQAYLTRFPAGARASAYRKLLGQKAEPSP
jgi:hypothetical protein